MKIVFFGTPPFSAKILDAVISKGFEIAAVISKPDKPKGRNLQLQPTPVKELIQIKYPHIPLFQPEKVSDPSFFPTIDAIKADLFVVVAYGEIIKQTLLDLPKLGCINVHTSLLPKYRGAAPIQRSIINGEIETGVTIMHMVKKMDAGDIISQKAVPIPSDMTYGELEEALLEASIPLLIQVLNEKTFPHIPQDESKVTMAPKVELEECEILWSHSSDTIHNLVRGVNPEPGAWVKVHIKGEKKRLKVFKTAISPLKGNPGAILEYGKNNLTIAAKEGGVTLLDVQLEGKKRMTGGELMRGIQEKFITFNI